MGSAVCGHCKVSAVQTLDNKPDKLIDQTTDPRIGPNTSQQNSTSPDHNTRPQVDCKIGQEIINNIAQDFDHQSSENSAQQISETEYQKGVERTVFESTDPDANISTGKINHHRTIDEKKQDVKGVLEEDKIKADNMECENIKHKERDVKKPDHRVESDDNDEDDDDDNDDDDYDDGDNDDDDDGEEGEGDGRKKKKKTPNLTAEELTQLKDKIYGILRETVKEVIEIKGKVNAKGSFAEMFSMEIQKAMWLFNQSYFSCKRTTLEDRVKYRLEIADIIIETQFYEIFCETLIKTYPQGWKDSEGAVDDKKYAFLVIAILALGNFTDQSEPLRMAVADYPGFLEMVKQALEDYAPRHKLEQEPPLSEKETKILNYCFMLLHNISMTDGTVTRLRSLDFMTTTQIYLTSPEKDTQLDALATLAGMINEAECDVINAVQSSVKQLLKRLRKGIELSRRRYKGWTCRECAFTVRKLAQNDANVHLLVELGALELLIKMGRTGSEAELYESVQGIWALCFDKLVQQKVVAQEYEGGVVSFLYDVKQTAGRQVKQACNRALWTLKDTLRTSNVQQYKEIGKKLESSIEEKKESEQEETVKFGKKKSSNMSRDPGHVMVSYQWANQQMLKEIRDRIKQHGYKVWMDIDEMGGSTLQAMAEAVENAELVLMCMSTKYKHSPNCRAEAEYAFQKKKRIIPLKMEQGYEPDGWLGLICGANLFYDFSGKYPFEDKMGGLLKEMDNVLQASNDRNHTDHAMSSVKSTVVPVVHAEPPRGNDTPDGVSMTTVAKVPVTMATIQAVRKWGPDEVNKWRKKKNIASSVPKLNSGEEVAFLLSMRVESPAFFFRCVQDMLNGKDISSMARLFTAHNTYMNRECQSQHLGHYPINMTSEKILVHRNRNSPTWRRPY